MTDANALAIALTPAERDLLVSALRLVEAFDADLAETRPVIELLEAAMTVREARRAVAEMTA